MVLAVPVAPHETLAELAPVVDDVLCVASPYPFAAIGQWYDDFRQTSDAEVSDLLDRARQQHEDRGGRSSSADGDGDQDAAPRS